MAKHRNLDFLKKRIINIAENIGLEYHNKFESSIKNQEYWDIGQKQELESQGDFALTRNLLRPYEGGGGKSSIPEAIEKDFQFGFNGFWKGTRFIVSWGNTQKLIDSLPSFMFYEFGSLSPLGDNSYLDYPLTKPNLIGDGWFFVSRDQLSNLKRPFKDFGRYGEGLILSGKFIDKFSNSTGNSVLSGVSVKPIRPVGMYRNTAMTVLTDTRTIIDAIRNN